jgi:hypothetical protein
MSLSRAYDSQRSQLGNTAGFTWVNTNAPVRAPLVLSAPPTTATGHRSDSASTSASPRRAQEEERVGQGRRATGAGRPSTDEMELVRSSTDAGRAEFR